MILFLMLLSDLVGGRVRVRARVRAWARARVWARVGVGVGVGVRARARARVRARVRLGLGLGLVGHALVRPLPSLILTLPPSPLPRFILLVELRLGALRLLRGRGRG